MIESAGILFKHNDSFLLCHSTNSPWRRSWMPPKGHIEEGETPQIAARRETFEEIGISYTGPLTEEPYMIPYIDKNGKTYKRVFIYVVEVDDEYRNSMEIIPQMEEVDTVSWIDRDRLELFAHPRFLDFVNKLD